MALVRSLKLVLLTAAALYIAVSGLGPALTGIMPMADGHACTMGITELRVCPMPVGEHLGLNPIFRTSRESQLLLVLVSSSRRLQTPWAANSRGWNEVA